MATKFCDDCNGKLGKRYQALDGRYLCSRCRGLRAEAFEIILEELTHRTRNERLMLDARSKILVKRRHP
jgi:hypothetical protein